MYNLNLATSVHNYRTQAVNYVSTMTNPVLNRLAALTVVPLDAVAYLTEQPLNACQSLRITISRVPSVLTASTSLSNLNTSIEATLIATTNALARAITVIPFTIYNLAQGIRNPTQLEALDAPGEINDWIIRNNLHNPTENFTQNFNTIFGNTVLQRPAALLYVTINRIANIVNTAFFSLTALTMGIIETATLGYVSAGNNDGSVNNGLIKITAGLPLAGICASRIATSPLYLIHHYAINLFGPLEDI